MSGTDGRLRLLRRRSAVDPAWYHGRRNPVADLPFCNAFAQRDDLAGSVRKGHRRKLHTRIILAADDHYVAVIQRQRVKFDKDFVRPRFWNVTLHQHQILYAKLLYLVCRLLLEKKNKAVGQTSQKLMNTRNR